MRAAFIEKPGPADSIAVGELPKPSPGSVQALVKIAMSAVNPIDTYIRSGAIPMAIPLPYIPGCDFAGVIEAVGSRVSRFKVGDRVWGTNQGLFGKQGTSAEYAAIDEQWLYPIPEGVAFREVAALALVGITAHLGLFRDARLKSGESLFVNGGSGGVGSAVVQMARAVGVRVLTTAGSDAKCQRAVALGADRAVNYHTEDVDEAIKHFAPDGVDVWWETLREPNFERAIPLLAKRGRLIVMAGREARPVFPVGPFYTMDRSIHGFAMFNASSYEQEVCARDINRWIVDGKLRANIDRVLPLDQITVAHQVQEDNTLRKAGTLSGKILIEP